METKRKLMTHTREREIPRRSELNYKSESQKESWRLQGPRLISQLSETATLMEAIRCSISLFLAA